MTNKSRIIFSVTVFIVFFFSMESWGADWTLYREGAQGGNFYYDAESIYRPAKNIVRVWTKLVYNEYGARMARHMSIFFENKYDGPLTHYLSLTEYNCVEKQFRDLKKIYYYDTQPMVSKSDVGKWDYVSPETLEEDLLNIVCK